MTKEYPVIVHGKVDDPRIAIMVDDSNYMYHKVLNPDGSTTDWRSADRDLRKVGIHTAWSHSRDGVTRFMKGFPNENLLKNTLTGEGSMYSTYGATKTETKLDGMSNIYSIAWEWGGLRYLLDDLINDGTFHEGGVYTLSSSVRNSGNAPVEFSGVTNGIGRQDIGASKYTIPNDGKWYRVNFSFTVMSISTSGQRRLSVEPGTNPTGLSTAGLKLEVGSVGSPYAPRKEENYDMAVPRFRGLSLKDSSDPNDYVWERYIRPSDEQVMESYDERIIINRAISSTTCSLVLVNGVSTRSYYVYKVTNTGSLSLLGDLSTGQLQVPVATINDSMIYLSLTNVEGGGAVTNTPNWIYNTYVKLQ